MDDLWSCVKLLWIVKRLQVWALETFKPWVDKWIKEGSESEESESEESEEEDSEEEDSEEENSEEEDSEEEDSEQDSEEKYCGIPLGYGEEFEDSGVQFDDEYEEEEGEEKEEDRRDVREDSAIYLEDAYDRLGWVKGLWRGLGGTIG